MDKAGILTEVKKYEANAKKAEDEKKMPIKGVGLKLLEATEKAFKAS